MKTQLYKTKTVPPKRITKNPILQLMRALRLTILSYGILKSLKTPFEMQDFQLITLCALHISTY